MAVIDDHLVGSAHDGEFSRWAAILQIAQELLFVQLSSFRDGAMIQQHRNGWGPFLKLIDPVGQRAQGSDD